MMTIEIYSIYLTSEQDGKPSGTVINRVMWSGTSTDGWQPPTGSAAVADPNGDYAVGTVYTPPVQ